MRKLIQISLLLLLVVPTLFGQTVTNLSNATIPCCNFKDSVDYNLDGIYDIEIRSLFGVDNFAYFTNSLSNIEITSPKDSGQIFGNYAPSSTGLMLTATTFVCNGWFSVWIPGTAPKYVGFRDVSLTNDTVYGWLKIDFVGQQNSCADTMFVMEVTYNTVFNASLYAGEKILASDVKEIKSGLDFITIYPNPGTDNIQVANNLNSFLELQIRSISGKIITDKMVLFPSQAKTINTSSFAKGIYIVESKTQQLSTFKKLIIQ